MKKVLIYGVGIILVVIAALFIFGGKKGNGQELKLVTVEKGNIAEKALAVGTIEPDKEIKVKSTISGIIAEVFFKIGDLAEKDQPLFKISPNPTPLEYVETMRNMEIAEITMKQLLKEKERYLSLYKDRLISLSDMDAIEARYNEINLRYKVAKEKFQLLEKGRIMLSDKNINSVITSPIKGAILSQTVYEGDPVVPLTNFQPGTELCAMADLGKILFKGTVDEIDVGKLEPGMLAEIQVGALPNVKVEGRLLRISPKAKKDGNATLFDIEVAVLESSGKTLRAGYSATAYIKTQERKDVLLLPERVVIFDNGKQFVEVKEGETISKVEIKTGLSDSVIIEIVEGLKQGQQVVERPPREIK
ncbi:MAG: efflux RND transporter periplasmic adaptor subunit [Candidatus Aminicenantes bacterium]|nr:efflux RND transporter periplasmic adaptor subunit [Candidatus Aminicenantes bacterium]